MSTEIAPLTAVQDKIKGKIKAEFVDLIPDEMWSAMVQSVITDFTTDKRNPLNASMRGRETEAPIKKMIREAIEAECKSKISAQLAKHSADFEGFGVRVISEATQELIQKNMPAMITAMQEASVKMMVDMAIQNMRNSMHQY